MGWAGVKQSGVASAQVRTFASDRGGNVAMLWALMATVLLGLVGLTIDFTRAQMIRAQLQNAADGAALVAERSSNLPLSQRQTLARAFFDTEAGRYANVDSFLVTPLETGGHRVDVGYQMVMTLAQIVSDERWRINVFAEAEAQASPPIEVAIALDNTGSMQNDMDALRDGATELVEFLLSLDGDTVHVGLVPFVAQVNIGTNAPAGWLDHAGANPHHGELFEDRYIGYRGTSNGNSNGTCTGANFPTTYGGFAVRWVKGAAANGAAYNNTSRCYAFSPSQVNIFTLYNNLPASAAWGGCVESRPPPHDISDAAPTSAATRFVPYMAPDEGGDDTNRNNWITSTTYDRDNMLNVSGFTNAAHARSVGVYKYRSGVPVSLNTGYSNSARGPNRGCPTPIVPLTDDEDTVLDAIEDMEYRFGGGTNQIEGLVWAWRVLSPGEPFTEGRAYDDPNDPVRKVIVLFTDGANTSLDSSAAFGSEYSAMNVRRLWRTYQTESAPGVTTGGIEATYRRNVSWTGADDEASMVAYMDQRERDLCAAIKALNIEIYTIGFRLPAWTNPINMSSEERLLRDCASSTEHAFRADNSSELLAAFTAIGSGIGKLRITR